MNIEGIVHFQGRTHYIYIHRNRFDRATGLRKPSGHKTLIQRRFNVDATSLVQTVSETDHQSRFRSFHFFSAIILSQVTFLLTVHFLIRENCLYLTQEAIGISDFSVPLFYYSFLYNLFYIFDLIGDGDAAGPPLNRSPPLLCLAL